MADFSKQWCELNDPEMPWDFDILEQAEKLEPDYCVDWICEGFGFTYIAKDKDNNIILGFPDYNTDTMNWKTYEEVING